MVSCAKRAPDRSRTDPTHTLYTSELDRSAGGADPEVLLQDRLKKGKERLDSAIEALALLCEPVEPPKGELEHIHYFCGNTEIASDLQEREPQRAALYKATVALVRAYANIADELERSGYNSADIKKQLDHYLNVRQIIRKASGETLDLKAYEADMRHLIDTYIEADEPRTISPFDNMGLLELIVKTGIANAIAKAARRHEGQQERHRRDHREQRPQQDHQGAPERSRLLREDVGAARRDHRSAQGQGHRVRGIPEAHRGTGEEGRGGKGDDTPEKLDTPGKRALWNNLGQNEELALQDRRDGREARARWLARCPGPRANHQGGAVWRLAGCRRGRADLPHHQGAEGILMATRLDLGGVAVDVVFKDIKNVHLSVYPPTGRVRISAPARMSLDTIRVFAISKLDWIRQQQKKLAGQEREAPREYLDRESHYVWGKRYLLKVAERDEAPVDRVEGQSHASSGASGNR